MNRIVLLVLLALCAAAATAAAQAHGTHSPHAGKESRGLKALSAEEVEELLAGEGMGMAIPAELNGYPGPRHVLDLARELRLSERQTVKIRGIFEQMQRQAVHLGREYVERERELDQLFAQRRIDPARLAELTAAIGRVPGELRNVHLQAHLQTTALLTPEQIQAYALQRGYAPGAHDGRHHRE